MSDELFERYNLQAALNSDEPLRSQQIEQAFTGIRDPGEEPLAVYEYIASIRNHLVLEHSDQAADSRTGFSPYTFACISAGLVPTMVEIVRCEWLEPHVQQERCFTEAASDD